MYSISFRAYAALLLVFVLSFAAFAAVNDGGKAPNSTQTVDKRVGNRMIESTDGVFSSSEPEDYRFIVTTYLVKVRGKGIGKSSHAVSYGVSDVREHLDTLAKRFPSYRVVVIGVFDLKD